jgi:hypothetical protein
MRDITQERVDCVINKFQQILRHEPKGLDKYCVRILEPTEYTSLVASKIEAAYRLAGWTRCRCGRVWDGEFTQSEFIQLDLWR